jgi:hypothetical protein
MNQSISAFEAADAQAFRDHSTYPAHRTEAPLFTADSVELRVARSKDDLESAFKLLHDAYVDCGYMEPQQSGMRISFYNALPTTSTLIALHEGVIVGTVSLIRENQIGFPAERVFDLTEIRRVGGAVAEISALAIHARYRKRGSHILFALMKFMFHHARDLFGTRHLVIAVHPTHFPLYESLGFKRLPDTVDSYDFVNGAPAVGGHVDLATVADFIFRRYAHLSGRKNLYDYFYRQRLTRLSCAAETFTADGAPVMSPRLVKYFFAEQTSILRDMGEHVRGVLRSMYRAHGYAGELLW